MYNNPLFLLIFLSLFVKLTVCEPRATQAALICSNRTAATPDRQTVISNFLATMDRVTPLVDTQRYATVVNGTGDTAVYTFGECMKDLSRDDCNLCFAQCKVQIPRCRPFQLATRAGRLFFDGCYLRYDDYDFFNESLSSDDRTVCGSNDFGGNKAVFGNNAMELVRNLSAEAVKNDGFFVGSVNKRNVSVYGLAQCWEFVKGANCEKCLDDAVSRVNSCTPKEEGRALNAGCYLRYSTQRFYNNSGSNAKDGNGGEHKIAIIMAACAGVALMLMVTFVGFFLYRKLVRKRRERKQLGSLLAAVNNSKINFSYETLERATDYFHSSNKLGQGGSGSVYKGTLPDGKTVAVKRLFFNTTQWADHFFNEVKLISGIDHKNLVKLLGCSITGPESLLVYEYVSNQSLHDHLFGRKNVLQPLSWDARYKIILGTAEGLAYLHEESNLRIIHRDIKLSNILLDDDFTAKIADFGLARLFPEDKTHISTGIAGTLGYMAPEYAVRGKLSEKADIYSFGVVVFELICGKKNNSFADSYSILQMIWDLYGKGRLCEAVDPVLNGNVNEEEASRMLQIGLLCVQASAELRPPMSIIVKMLENSQEILQPKQPPYLSHSSIKITLPSTSITSNTQPEAYTSSSGSGNITTQNLIDTR